MKQFAHKELTARLNELEVKYNKQFKDVYDAINYLLKKDELDIAQKERKQIGFKRETVSGQNTSSRKERKGTSSKK